MEIDSLLQDAFLSAKQEDATQAIAEARAEVTREGKLGASNLEFIVPEEVDEPWLRRQLLQPLIYFCQSTGASIPDCPGVFLTLFARGHIHFILGAEVIAWSCQRLRVSWRELVASLDDSAERASAPH